MLIDTHCHLDFPEFATDRDEVIKRARDNGIGYIVNIGSSIDGSKASLQLAKKYDLIYAAVGVHPHEADQVRNDTPAQLEQLARNDKVVAIGEIGLDYFKNYSKSENQRPLFISLLELSLKLDLPVVIHSRQAQEDTLKILKQVKPKKVVIHCFSGDEVFLKEALEADFFVSFTCNVTYLKAKDLRAVLKLVPLERLMLETDAPFLPPEGLRGRRNEPALVKNLALEVAKIKEVEFEELARITTENAREFFNLP